MSHTLAAEVRAIVPVTLPGRTLIWALGASIALHLALVSGFLGHLQTLFETVTFAPPPRSDPLKARLIAPAPQIERVAAATPPPPVRPGAAQVVATGTADAASAPAAKAVKPIPDQVGKAAKKDLPPPAPTPKPAAEKAIPGKAPEPATPPAVTPSPESLLPTGQPPPEPAKPESAATATEPAPPKAGPTPAKIKLSPFPLEAFVSFNVIATDPKVTNPYHGSMRHHWREIVESGGSRYILKGEASAGFAMSETMTSEGIINEKGLTPTRHERARNRREPEVINFTPGSQVATVESKGEKRELKFSGDPLDMLSILYDLALDPGVAIGRKFAFARGHTVYQFVLRTKGQQAIETSAGKLDALYFDFKRAEGEGQIEVWLALDKGLLPAKMRMVSSRGEEVEMIASKYEITKPR